MLLSFFFKVKKIHRQTKGCKAGIVTAFAANGQPELKAVISAN